MLAWGKGIHRPISQVHMPRHHLLRRRALIQRSAALAYAGAGLVLLAGCGPGGPSKPTKIARVGFLSLEDVPPGRLAALRMGLRDRGWVDGENLTFVERYAGGDSKRLSVLAKELADMSVDIMTGPGSPPVLAARETSPSTPFVMLTTGDPVGLGLVRELARPGGNVTGMTILAPTLSGKRLEYLRAIDAALVWALVLTNTSNPSNALSVDAAEKAAAQMGLPLEVADVTSSEQLLPALGRLSQKPGGGLTLVPDTLLVPMRSRMVEWAAQTRTLAVYPAREYVEAGGLMCYGPNLSANYYRGSEYIDRILRGANPADLPVEQPTSFDCVVNSRTAQALGVTFSSEISAQVTEWL
jgi:putative ABC transport system substrate-binding protein